MSTKRLFMQWKEVEGVLVVALTGSAAIFDTESVYALKDLILGAVSRSVTNVVLNVARVEVIDAIGLKTLIECYLALRDVKGRLLIVKAPEPIRNLLELTKLAKFLELFPDEAAALASLRGDAK